MRGKGEGEQKKKRITNPLCVNLVDVGHTLRQNIAGHFIAELVSEFSSLSTSTVDRRTGIRDGTGHYTTHRRRNLKDVRDGAGVDEFVLETPSFISFRRSPGRQIDKAGNGSYGNFLLRDHNGTVLSSNAKRGDVRRGNRLECIFYNAKENIDVSGGTVITAVLKCGGRECLWPMPAIISIKNAIHVPTW